MTHVARIGPYRHISAALDPRDGHGPRARDAHDHRPLYRKGHGMRYTIRYDGMAASFV